MAGAARPDQRPLSPHVTVWRWHVTMATSILHRATGVGLYGGAVLLTFWLYAVADGPTTYAPVAAFLSSWLGQTVLYLLVASLAFHLANGIRHLVFDTGRGLTPADADLSAWFAILFAVAAPIGLWLLGRFGG